MTTHVESLYQYEFSYKVPTLYRTAVLNVQGDRRESDGLKKIYLVDFQLETDLFLQN